MKLARSNFSHNGGLLPYQLSVVISLITGILCSSYTSVIAQLCTEVSGQVVLNQTFGTTGNDPLPDGLTTYRYIPYNCPNDGQYSIVQAVAGDCWNSTWYSFPEDHTPNDTQGNMMIVNGATEPGIFYRQTISGLCGSSHYEFSFWAANVLRANTCTDHIIPSLAIDVETVNGKLIYSTSLGRVEQTQSPTWRQYSALFTLPPTTEEVVIKLVNKSGDFGCGNDMVIDDLQLKQCGECINDQVFVPDAFTPDRDGHNDALTVFISKAASFTFNIYNRWGSLVFSSTSHDKQWDGTYSGTPCATGNYTWVLSYKPDGAVVTSSELTRTGQVLLIR